MASWAACTAAQRDLARAVLGALGEQKEVADEEFVAMATALSGTGPTYLFAVMEALIDAGANVQLKDRQGNTPLQLARSRGYTEMVRMLERAGAK